MPVISKDYKNKKMGMKKDYMTILCICLTLVSHAQNPDLEWVKQVGGTGPCSGRSITTDANGNVYTTGRFSGIVDFPQSTGIQSFNSLGNYDVFIQKSDANSNVLWAKQIGSTYSAEGNSITVDANGNVYTTGHFQGTGDFDSGIGVQNLTATYNDIFIQKLDGNGNFLWAKQMVGNSTSRGNAITSDVDGNIYTTGYFRGTVDFDPGPDVQNFTSAGIKDIFIQKLDVDGNLLWAKQIGGSGNDYGSSITTDVDGNVYITGYFFETVDFDPGAGLQNFTSAGSSDIFVQKLDSNGNFVWVRQIKGGYTGIGQSITADNTRYIYVTGAFEKTADFDPGPGAQNLTATGMNDIFIQKLDIDGNFFWAKQIGGTDFDTGFSINTDNEGNVYTTGSFRATVDFDPGPGIQNFTSPGDADIFIQKLDADGSFLWTKQMGGTGTDHGHATAIDFDNNIYTTGSFTGTVDFDPGSGVQNLTSVGVTDIYIQKLGNSTVGLQDYATEGKSFTIYPNPNDGQFTITFEAVLSNIEVNIIDVHGRLIHSSQYQNTDNINLEINQPAGTYFVEVKTPEGKKTTSFIKK